MTANEQGLLGLAFAPDYAKSRLLVVNYTDRGGATRIVRYRSKGTQALPGSARVLLTVRQPYSNHNGGMVEFGPGGLLYVGMGDGGSGGDPENRAQDMGTLLGKLVRIERSARQPAGEDRRTRAPQPVALLVRQGERRSLDRRRRSGRGRGDRQALRARARARQLRLGRVRGLAVVSRTRHLAPASSCSPWRNTRTTTGARSRAVTSIAARRSPRRRAGTSTATTAAAGSGVSARRRRRLARRSEGFRVESLSSFGEDSGRRAVPRLAGRDDLPPRPVVGGASAGSPAHLGALPQRRVRESVQ